MGSCSALPSESSTYSKIKSPIAPMANNNNTDNDVDSDNDTQMSQNDNKNTNTNNNYIDLTDNSNDPVHNIDNNDNNNNNDNNDDDDGDATINDNSNNNNDNQPQKASKAVPPKPKFKYVWQWLENDGTWHDYDSITQLLLDQLSIGNKISIKAGKWTYDITKTSNDACTQINTQTQSVRTARRQKVLINPPSAAVAPLVTSTSSSGGGYIGSGQYVFMWQYLENDNKWKDLGVAIATKLENLPLKSKLKYTFGKWSYTVQKITNDECTQTNDSTQNQRDLRRILYDKINNKRICWQFNDDKGGWSVIDNNDLMFKLLKLKNGSNTSYTRGQWTYNITKTDNTHCTQKNTSTKKTRQFRLITKNHDEMDTNWSSKSQTNNQNYQAGIQQTANYAQYAPLFARFGVGPFGGAAANDNQAKDIDNIKLDPNDIQDVILLADDDDDDNDNNNNNNNHKNPKKKRKSLIKSVFGSNNNNNNNDNDIVADDSDNDDDDEKMSPQDQSEKVLMDDITRKIYDEFCLTMTKDAVSILSIQKIKDNASKSIVYEALLAAKKDELKNKNISDSQIERVLFHGTTFGNIAKIVNNGFNRDFNRHHWYGKGTYFSSLASESAKYCEADDKEQYVMLICRVIIGEYTKGTSDMDGSSIPYKSDKKTQYESCVNDIDNPVIFVINRDYHAIPTHIIKFKYKK